MFDPYHKWLGIQPSQRPPTHYQLLGIAPTEADQEVIEEAFIRQTTHLRTYKNGPYASQCTKLLNEVTQAHDVLTNPAKRKQYDAELAGETGAYQVKNNIKPISAPLAVEPAPAKSVQPKTLKAKRHHVYQEPRPKTKSPMVAILVSVGATAVVVLGALFLFGGSEQTPTQELAERRVGLSKETPSSRQLVPSQPMARPSQPAEEEAKDFERPTPPPTKSRDSKLTDRPQDEERKPPERPTPPPNKPDESKPPSKPPDSGGKDNPPPPTEEDTAPPGDIPVALRLPAPSGWSFVPVKLGTDLWTDRDYALTKLPKEVLGGYLLTTGVEESKAWFASGVLITKRTCTIYAITRVRCKGFIEVNDMLWRARLAEGWKEVQGPVATTFPPGEDWKWRVLKKELKKGTDPATLSRQIWHNPTGFVFK